MFRVKLLGKRKRAPRKDLHIFKREFWYKYVPAGQLPSLCDWVTQPEASEELPVLSGLVLWADVSIDETVGGCIWS